MMLTQQMLKRDCGKDDSKTLKVKHQCGSGADKIETCAVALLEIVFLELAGSAAAQARCARPDWRGVGHQESSQLFVSGTEQCKCLALCSTGKAPNPLGRGKPTVTVTFQPCQCTQQSLGSAPCCSARHERSWLQAAGFQLVTEE